MAKTASLTLLALMPMCAHAALHDCTESEPVTHHVARIVHNLLHPHHKLPPRPQFCGEPDMVTVTVEAPEPLALGAASSEAALDGTGAAGGYPVTYAATPWYIEPQPPAEDGKRYIGPHDPHPVPEPADALVLLPVLLVMLWIFHRRVTRGR
jgi:hypothetical protein